MIVAISVICVSLILKFGNPLKKFFVKEGVSDEQNLITPTGVESFVSESTDTDSDGLFDWEETLRGTNLQNSDSDGDGTTDGDEIKQERNPLLAGPNDVAREAIDNSIIDTASSEADINAKQTVSSELSKNLLTQLVYLKQNGGLTAENKQELVKSLTSFTAESFSYRTYKKEELLIIENSTSDDLRIYASNFATIQVDLLTNIAQRGDAIINDVGVLSSIYAASAKKLSEIAIPRVLADIHVNIVNNYSIVSKALESFKDDSDPAKKTIAIGAYQNATVNQEQSLGIIATYLRQNGILFTSDQVGDYWNNF